MERELLGGLGARSFLQRHWQKRPLFVRGALPGLRAAVDLRKLAALASRDDVESRIVVRAGGKWRTTHGPVARKSIFPARDWTLLVNGVNLHVRAAEALLRRFAFVPQARLDDVMVSYAAPGGGVGPHVDSYDVFLVQGPGRRKWTVWHSGRKKHYVCEPGDLLYLPPGVRHDGVALEPCFTYSIGFRAPKGAELAARFLDWLHERGLPDAAYRDPGLAPAGHAAAVPQQMVRFAQSVLKRIRWSKAETARFLGEYLTEPKAHVVFRPRPSGRRLAGSRLRLDAKTQLLYLGDVFFMNGEALRVPARQGRLLRELADRRELDGAAAAASALRDLLYDWRSAGYLHFEPRRAP
jgi:50S ribosomal protein L16 3-hydroxylase